MTSDTRAPCKFPRHLKAAHAVRLLGRWIAPFCGADGAGAAWLRCLLLQLSSQRTSFAAVVRRALALPCASLLGKKWRAWRLSRSMAAWEVELDAALRAPWQAVLAGERVWLIADWHSVPYWGQVSPELAPWVRRGPAQSGTTRFLVYATVAVLWRGVRIQVACTAVGAEDGQAAVFQRLFERVQPLGLRPLGWIMDKGFYAAGVVATLREQGPPYLIAAPRRGEKEGIAALLKEAEAKYGFQEAEPPPLTYAYTVTAMDRSGPPQPTTVYIGWEAVPEPAKKRRQRTLRRSATAPGQRWRAIAWIGGGRNWTTKKAQRAYAPRTGFESGYRLSKGCRGRTSSQDPRWRLVLFAVSLLLQNAWVFLLLGGQRTLHRRWKRLRDHLPFIDFCCWIVRVLERQTGHRLAVVLPKFGPTRAPT
jgi:hypothetical protein